MATKASSAASSIPELLILQLNGGLFMYVRVFDRVGLFAKIVCLFTTTSHTATSGAA